MCPPSRAPSGNSPEEVPEQVSELVGRLRAGGRCLVGTQTALLGSHSGFSKGKTLVVRAEGKVTFQRQWISEDDLVF